MRTSFFTVIILAVTVLMLALVSGSAYAELALINDQHGTEENDMYARNGGESVQDEDSCIDCSDTLGMGETSAVILPALNFLLNPEAASLFFFKARMGFLPSAVYLPLLLD